MVQAYQLSCVFVVICICFSVVIVSVILSNVISLYIAVQTAVLGFQHYIVMLGTTVMISTALVPRMGGSAVRLLSSFLHLLKIA